MTLALIDADIIAYRCAASAEHNDEPIALWRVNDLVRRILHETNATDYIGFLSGSDNFRYGIYPEYKANRKDKPRPRHLEACKELLITEWKCKVTHGIEADDALGIEHQADESTVLCSIDKDLLQIPGKHYNFVKNIFITVSPLDGLRSFYKQLITGDSSDNIPAFDGKFRNSLPKFVEKLLAPLDTMTKELDMYNYCFSIYKDFADLHPEEKKDVLAELHRNASLLYIMKKEDDYWTPPTTTTMGDGQEEDFADSLRACYDQELESGPLSTTL